MFGPPPLGPGAPPIERLLAYGRERLRFVRAHHALLSDGQPRPAKPVQRRGHDVHHRHVRVLLEDAGTTGDLDAQADALLALLDADYVHHQLTDRGQTLEQLGDAWESVARKLCGR